MLIWWQHKPSFFGFPSQSPVSLIFIMCLHWSDITGLGKSSHLLLQVANPRNLGLACIWWTQELSSSFTRDPKYTIAKHWVMFYLHPPILRPLGITREKRSEELDKSSNFQTAVKCTHDLFGSSCVAAIITMYLPPWYFSGWYFMLYKNQKYLKEISKREIFSCLKASLYLGGSALVSSAHRHSYSGP